MLLIRLMINPAVFCQYDIRGSSISDITPQLAYKIGFCFARMHLTEQNNNICIGRDGRNSSKSLFNALAQGVNAAGGKVLNIGLVPTPLLYFTDLQLKPAASIMITASHNPKDDNGFKLLAQNKPFFGTQVQELYNQIIQTPINFVETPCNFSAVDLTEQYLAYMMNELEFNPKLKVAWDPGNGVACEIIKELQKILPNTNIIINDKIDGNFPSHPPDPTKLENLQGLIEFVLTNQYDFGIALDGDGDRVSVITSEGALITGDQLTCLFAKDVLLQHPARHVILDIKASQTIFDQIKAYQGIPIMTKTGHVFIKEAMQRYAAILGGEVSGHLFFVDKYFGYDDGIYAALRFIDLISRSGLSVQEMLEQIPKTYTTPEIRLEVTEEQKLAPFEQLKKYLISNKIKFNDLDGVRADMEQGWWLIRASNTENALVIRYEANTIAALEQINSNVNNILHRFWKLSI